MRTYKVKLGDISVIVSGNTAPKDDKFNEYVGLPFIRAGHLEDLCNGLSLNKLLKISEDNAKGLVRVPKGTVIFAKSGMSCLKNRVYVTDQESYIVNHLAGVICKSEKLIPQYLRYYLLNYNLSKLALDQAYPSIRISDIKNIELEVPDVIRQNYIVNLLEKAEFLINKRKNQLEMCNDLIKSQFIKMFGDPIANDKKLKICKLSDVSDCFIGLTYKPEDVSDNGIIVLRSSNIKNNQLDFTDIVRVNKKINEELFVKKNDILMCSRNGSARLVGKVALIDKLEEPMSFGAFMTIIRSEYYSYLVTYFQLDAFRRQIVTGATTTINQITTSMLDNIILPIPDENELNQYTSFFNKVSKLKCSLQQSLTELECNFNALMQKSFNGELFE